MAVFTSCLQLRPCQALATETTAPIKKLLLTAGRPGGVGPRPRRACRARRAVCRHAASTTRLTGAGSTLGVAGGALAAGRAGIAWGTGLCRHPGGSRGGRWARRQSCRHSSSAGGQVGWQCMRRLDPRHWQALRHQHSAKPQALPAQPPADSARLTTSRLVLVGCGAVRAHSARCIPRPQFVVAGASLAVIAGVARVPSKAAGAGSPSVALLTWLCRRGAAGSRCCCTAVRATYGIRRAAQLPPPAHRSPSARHLLACPAGRRRRPRPPAGTRGWRDRPGTGWGPRGQAGSLRRRRCMPAQHGQIGRPLHQEGWWGHDTADMPVQFVFVPALNATQPSAASKSCHMQQHMPTAPYMTPGPMPPPACKNHALSVLPSPHAVEAAFARDPGAHATQEGLGPSLDT
jgi:hypothetical protein